MEEGTANLGAPDGAALDALRSRREHFASMAYHHGHCAEAHDCEPPTFEELFQCAELLEHCQALRDSATGMGDPLRHPEWIRNYIRTRLDKWREPTDEWDGYVRALCGYALANYHALGEGNATFGRPQGIQPSSRGTS